ncbi:MAG: Ig-like domain-containing protein [Synechococcaceae cyanobacterium ELA739]
MAQFFNPADNPVARFNNLEEALCLLEARLTSWAGGELIGTCWGQGLTGESGSSSPLDEENVDTLAGNTRLTGEFQGSQISLESVDGTTLIGAGRANKSSAYGQDERIILSLDWLQSATSKAIAPLLLANFEEASQWSLDSHGQADGSPLAFGLTSGSPGQQRENPLQQSLLDAVLATASDPATPSTDPTSSINLDATNPIHHLNGCGCSACGLPDPFASQSGTTKVKPSSSFAALGTQTTQSAPAPAASLQVLADYLQTGYWAANGTVARRYNLGSSGNNPNNGILYYNISGWSADPDGISTARKSLVREVFKLYKAVLGIDFQETTSTGDEVDFFFRDNASGAYSGPRGASYSDGIDWTEINIAANWYGSSSAYVGYTLQTIEHEVGHALGLGHQGTYNGTVDYATQAVYANDSWLESMMSYLPQNSSPYFSAYNPNTAAAGISYSWLQTPMAADWIALNAIYAPQGYGVNRAFLGDTIYGVGTNITSTVSDVWNKFSTNAGSTTFTLIDGSGYDRLDVSNFSNAQLINLAPSSAQSTSPSYSNIGGKVGNLTIAVGTIIEAATGGSGADTFYGNDVANTFVGNAGNDAFYDSLGSDIYYGGADSDTLYFSESINLFSIAYDPTTSFLSISKSAATDVDLAYSDIESISFNGSAYAFSSFIDNTPPVLASSTPADDAQGVALASNINLIFSENVKAGTGFLVLSNGTDVRSINITDTSQVVFAGANVTINPSLDLVAGSTYSLQLAAGVIQDVSGNSFAGINNSTTLNFATVALPQLAIAATDATKAEGNSGSTAYTFTVSRSGDTSGNSSATWAVAGSAVNPANAADFQGGNFPSGTVVFASGETSQLITVLVSGDSTVELDEGFTVTLANAVNATISTASATSTITNDDVLPLPALAIAATDATKAEGNSGSTAYTFTVSRDGDLSASSTANWSVSGIGTNAATASDFNGGLLPSGTVTFAAGVASEVIMVLVVGDSVVENDEEFAVTLSTPSNAMITTASASGTIHNDDTAAPVVTQVSASPSDGVLAVGETVRLTVVFSSDVFVTGIPALNLANGGVATYSSGSGSTSLNFTYVVNASNTSTADLATASSNAFSLPGGAAISNLLGTAAVLSGANAVNPAGILAVDTTLPGATSMAVNGNTIILGFSEVVKGANLIAANFSRQIGTAVAVSASAISLDPLSNKVTLTFTGTAPVSTSAVNVTYAAISGSATSGLITDQAGNPLTVFSNQVVDTYQSAATVSALGDGTTTMPATSFANLVLTGTSAINGTGNALANTITGNSAVNVLNGNAGVDLIDGSGAGDLYLVSSSADHGAAEFRDSGLTGIDEVRFTSVTAGQTLTLFAGDTGLETAVIGTGSAPAAVTTGTTALNIDASAAANGLTITGNAGANRLTGTAYADILNGNAGNDTIAGLAGADSITGGAGLDVLSGGADADSFIYTTLSDGVVGGTSTARTFELITDFQVGLDRIDAPGTAVRAVKVLGAVTALTDTAIGNLLNASSAGTVNFAANGASTFTFGTGATIRTFLAINNVTASYSATADPIVEITGYGLFNGATSLANLTIS